MNSLFLSNGQIKASPIKIMIFILLIALSAATFAIEPANPNASSNAKLILNFFSSLKSRTDHRLVSGQFIGYSGGTYNSEMLANIYKRTGKWIGIAGSDYAHWSPSHQIKYEYTNPELLKAWKAGSLVALQVHMTNPANPNGGGLRDTNVDLNQLLVPGTDTYSRWIAEMDIIAQGLGQLQDSGVVVLFRPFHEMNGSWFWWGGKNTALFVNLWKQMFNYFTITKKLNNLLWVYGPNMGSNAANYYPGDAYVDITGLDAYTSNITTSGISGYSALVNLGKPFGFTEFGPENASTPSGNFDYRIFINGLKTNFPQACFFLCWDDKWGLTSNTYVTESLSDPYVANRDNLNWGSPTGLIPLERENPSEEIRLFPNPLKKGNNLSIKLQKSAKGEEVDVSIFDISGKLISKQTLHSSSSGKMELKNSKNLQPGMYLINVESNKASSKIHLEVI